MLPARPAGLRAQWPRGAAPVEPPEPRRVCRRVRYGPLVILYDCQDSAVNGECNRDVLKVSLDLPLPERVAAGRLKVGLRNRRREQQRRADALAGEALEALQKALRISLDELIENAPLHEDLGPRAL